MQVLRRRLPFLEGVSDASQSQACGASRLGKALAKILKYLIAYTIRFASSRSTITGSATGCG